MKNALTARAGAHPTSTCGLAIQACSGDRVRTPVDTAENKDYKPQQKLSLPSCTNRSRRKARWEIVFTELGGLLTLGLARTFSRGNHDGMHEAQSV